ncbi:carboxymuconolactone decarboxylase family protein [Phenylobacterium terrae]|uniref:Carboxymuconolactone decarboxylase family protein n=1 Tax=Phenylobacterium terrae TaxID=2665495 RepID=A0ABW4N242_9CAUL
MRARINPHQISPKALQPMLDMEAYLAGCGLEHSLIELVKMRVSQINGCAYCLHMHSRDARAAGESEERLHLLAAWRESSLYTDRERAALAWAESLTRIADTAAPDADFEPLRACFTEAEIVDLTLLITTINAWNRIAVGFRSQHPRTWAKAAA